MQTISNVRKLSRVLRNPSHLQSQRFALSDPQNLKEPPIICQRQTSLPISHHISTLPDATYQIRFPLATPNVSLMAKASYTSEATPLDGGPTETAREIYDKMLKSVEGRTMPPNKLLWSLIEKCETREDIALLFQMLQDLRRFRLSNLRIHDNFNCTICLKVVEACARAGAIDYGKKVLWEHNKYGLTPSVSCANHLLLFAKKHKDSKLMVEIMKLLKRNHLPLQPSTADIIFSICYDADDWELISKYAHKFTKDGVKLRRTTFGTWMAFAAKRGDVESMWKIEKLRSKAMEKHNLATAFSCAKGFLLERKPENAAAIIHILNEKLPVEKKAGIASELQQLVSKWPLEVIKHQTEEDRKQLASSLEKDIRAMINGLMNMGVKVSVNLDDLNLKEAIPS